MKNQYFGDNRDLFKFDLVQRILDGGLVSRFTYIPMLTANDTTKDGGQYDRSRAKAGTENRELMSFLDGCISNGKKNIVRLEDYFGKKITIYRKNSTFSHKMRKEYFSQIKKDLLQKALVLVDPDIGLEVANTGEKHIRMSEVKGIYDCMGDGSILMLYQHFPRVDHLDYLHQRGSEIKEKVSGEGPICIDDDSVIFFFLTQSHALEESLTTLISDYAERYTGQGD